MCWVLFRYFPGLFDNSFLLAATNDPSRMIAWTWRIFVDCRGSLITNTWQWPHICGTVSWSSASPDPFFHLTNRNNWPCLGLCFPPLLFLNMETLECSLTLSLSKLIPYPHPQMDLEGWKTKGGCEHCWHKPQRVTVTAILKYDFPGNYPKKPNAWKCLNGHPVGKLRPMGD